MPTALALTAIVLTAAVITAPYAFPHTTTAFPVSSRAWPPPLPRTRAALAIPSARAPALTPSPSRYGWPLAPPHPVLRPFLPPSSPYGPGHRGVDLGAAAGEPVLAAADGVVSFAGWVATRGVVAVAHTGGMRTTYEPVRPEVAPGQRVRRGEEVGRLMPGHAGCVAACLHWGARRADEYLDPLRLLSTQRVRLLPWREPPPGEVA
ncbi:M23 family metallopeptidase [Kutzneria kofuensis]|uniref:Murein DD-endopeptidase MepM/ murein hydrolase activator NlpD n=1 Tax=Kutzneria kofuensis TaxID=103725 RepID=A0A7W9KKA0_9PSEU|nr:M23 family metallopeptidase [Kutzneria kofuensis]MBB5894133.1 murein DD-endopeptidase MepM/ murein hydrolase activator NlpD [Kutzneria kofuensis]